MLAHSRKRTCATAQSPAYQNAETESSPALQNHLVLERITNFLPVTSLKQFRAVSQMWNQESLPAIKRRVQPIDFSKSTMTVAKIKSFLALINNSSSGFPCVDFEISTELEKLHRPLFIDVLHSISSFVKKLDLHINDYTASDEIASMQFPSLKSLKLNQMGFDGGKTVKALKYFQFIVPSSPALEKIYLTFIGRAAKSILPKFIHAIGTHPNIQTVNELSLKMDITNDLLRELARVGLHLKSLTLSFNKDTNFTPENFQAFLESQRNVLEVLVLESRIKIFGQKPVLLFPRMEKLKVLNFSMDQANVVEFSFAKLFPALNHLTLSCLPLSNGRYERVLCSQSEPLNTLESLVLAEDFDNFRILDHVSRIFPKLTKLELGKPNIISRTVGWPADEIMLSIKSSERITKNNAIFKKLVTGYTKAELKILEREWLNSGNLQLKADKEPAEVFQQLKLLRIHQVKVTDIFCLVGPMKMISLECLDLTQCPNSQVSRKMLKQMNEKFMVKITKNCPKTRELFMTKSVSENIFKFGQCVNKHYISGLRL